MATRFNKPDEPPRLRPEEMSANSLLTDISKCTAHRVRAGGDAFGLKQGYRNILFHLARDLDGATQQDIVRRTKLSAPTISVTLKRMEKDGYVTRTQDDNDARSVRVELTEKGWNLDQRMREVVAGLDKDVDETFTEEELVEFRKLLVKLRAKLLPIDGDEDDQDD